jgi:hypothetical protein
VLTPVEVRRIHKIIVEVLRVTMPPESRSEARAATVPGSGRDRNRDAVITRRPDLNVSRRRG